MEANLRATMKFGHENSNNEAGFESNFARDQAMRTVPERALRFATFELIDSGLFNPLLGTFFPPAEILSSQMPAYAMQLIASAAGDELDNREIANFMIFGINVAPRYRSALRAFVGYAIDSVDEYWRIPDRFGFGGIVDPHLPQTYVFISKLLAGYDL